MSRVTKGVAAGTRKTSSRCASNSARRPRDGVEARQLSAQREVDQDRVAAAPLPLRLHHARARPLSRVDQTSYHFGRHGGLIDERDQHGARPVRDRSTPRAIDAPISLDSSSFKANRTDGDGDSLSLNSPARWPTTTTTSPTPAALKLSTHVSTTVLSPNGSSGLNAPIRRERPAASSTAETVSITKGFRMMD